jgi:carboxypeptidase family protein
VREVTFLLILSLLCVALAIAQSPTATINGIVLDPSGAAIAGAQVVIVNDATGIQFATKTNGEGIYVVPNLPPGPYRIQVSNGGFKTIIKPDIVIHVQDALAINFTLPIGAASEVVTVDSGALQVNTESAAVSTVVDREFAENLPMNGRSFQTLIQLTPGVVLAASTNRDAGQFSVNGERPTANYWMVDGVSANIGVSPGFSPSNGFGGALGSYSALGGTNSLVSVDALQEFRIQTSSYAPEFGRTPGAQISIITRSGTNDFHGTLFNYFRNDVLDANDWFADQAGLKKPEERQNDFGGTLSGRFIKDRAFFFFSYEGLRLRLPQVAQDTVPDLNARLAASPALQPFLNMFPRPNGSDNTGTGVAQFNSSFSNPAMLNAYSLRIDHRLSSKLSLFGRYNNSPSEFQLRGNNGSSPLSTVFPLRIATQTATVGGTWTISPSTINDLRFNYSRTNAGSQSSLDSFGGAVPLTSLPFPSGFTPQNSALGFDIFSLAGAFASLGQGVRNTQQQINAVDNLSAQKGSHSLKFGVDLRRLSPAFEPVAYRQTVFFLDVPSAGTGNVLVDVVQASTSATLLFRNLGMFAQDTWRVIPRLTLTYGLRWDVDFSPSSISGPSLPAVTGFNLKDFSNLALALSGTPPFKTTYGNLAPRLGVAYQISGNQDWGLVVRSGFGVFFDLATSEAGNLLSTFSYPFGASKFGFGGTFPLASGAASPPSITSSSLGSGTLFAFDPSLELPYALEWNVALEQGLGRQQSISASYIGAVGRRLIQTTNLVRPNQNFGQADLVGNTATSDYSALQFQFQRRLSRGLQALASYTWSHSIDTASAGSFGNAANLFVPLLNPNANRGPSDFDIRNAFSAAVTYDIPAPKANVFTNAVLRGWSLQNVIQARSAPPVNVFYSGFGVLLNSATQVRPDLIGGAALYLNGPQYPGGKALNLAAFTPPPTDSSTGLPLRQGNLGRNALRGFGATQWDFAVHRNFPVHDSLTLQFRAELFNVLNHPNFGQPVGDLRSPQSVNPQFGRSIQMLGQSLGSTNVGGGGFDPLYQVGGPRSIQLALKLMF